MNLEDRVRDALADERYALPGWPDPMARIMVGVVRRRRRRMVTAAGALVVAVILVSVPLVFGRALERTSPLPADGVVPWVDGVAPAPTNLARSEPRSPARPCTADDLGSDASWNTAWLEDGGTKGTAAAETLTAQSVLVGNHNDTPCTLSGSATIVAVDPATGRRTLVPTIHGTAFDGGIKRYPATLDPGSPAHLDVVTRTSCPGKRYRDAEIVVGEISLRVPALVISPDCPVSVGDWYVEPPLLNAPLTVTMTAPGEVRRGETFSYEVSVLDALGWHVRLDPCPVYQQRLGPLVEWRRLNCVVTTLPAHVPVRFAMRMTVPLDAPLGRTTLQWMAVMADGHVAIANIDTGGARVTITE